MDLKNVKTEAENIQQWKANLVLGKLVYGTKSGEVPGPLKAEKGRLRDWGLMNDHDMYELVKNADARGGCKATSVMRPDADLAKQIFHR